MHRIDLGFHSHPKEFWGNGVRNHVDPKGKIPSTGKKITPEEDRTHDAASSRTASPTHYQRAIIIIIIIIIIILIIIAFKGAIRDFLQSPHSAANCLQHVRSSGPGAIVCKSRATHRALIACKCHVTCHLVQRDSSAIKFDRTEIAFS